MNAALPWRRVVGQCSCCASPPNVPPLKRFRCSRAFNSGSWRGGNPRWKSVASGIAMEDAVLKMLPHGGGGWNTRRREPEGSSLCAVIETGGKQYSVAAGDTITVMALAGNPGDRVTFDRVLMLSQDAEPALGTPFVDGASVC